MRILAVDDKAVPRRALERAIRAAQPDAKLTVCASSAEVLARSDAGSFDVAFVDVDMPGKNGISLARELKGLNPRINVIFATGYGEYMADAFALHSSGYLTKPITVEAVASELANLRFPPTATMIETGLFMRCFGDFEAFTDGRALAFKRAKSKELLAFLVDRRGAMVPLREVDAALWEEAPRGGSISGSYLRTLVADLKHTLEAEGHMGVLIRRYGQLGLDTKLFSCDYYNFLHGEPLAIRDWCGEYMNQYSWAEPTRAALLGRPIAKISDVQ